MGDYNKKEVGARPNFPSNTHVFLVVNPRKSGVDTGSTSSSRRIDLEQIIVRNR